MPQSTPQPSPPPKARGLSTPLLVLLFLLAAGAAGGLMLRGQGPANTSGVAATDGGNTPLDGAGQTTDLALKAAPPEGSDKAQTGDLDAQSTSGATVEPQTPPVSKGAPNIEPAPSFDVVRVDASGGALIAGRAMPGQSVQVMLDGVEVSRVQSVANGDFVTMLDLPASASPRVLSLRTGNGGVLSDASVILAPVLEPALIIEDTEDEPLKTAQEAGTAVQPDTPQAPEVAAPLAGAGTSLSNSAVAQNANAAPAVLLASAEGVRVLQPSGRGGAEPTAAVILDAISYGADGGVVLSGRAAVARGGHVRIYLNNAAVETAPLALDGTWQSPLSGVAAGVYTLRVDQLGQDGKVASRFETPFKREAREVLDRAHPVQTGTKGVTVEAVTVQPGATLWAIASDRYGDGAAYVKVFDANTDLIRDPDLIYPGQVFDLPK